MKKSTVRLLSALTALLMLASCSPLPEKTTAEPTVSETTQEATATEKAPEELVAEYRRQTDERIAEIKASPNIEIPEGATVYYVSPNGSFSNDGRSPETPWKKITEKLNERLKPGDYVLFERGGVWRGTIMTVEGVTYSSYGEGEKPMFYGYTRNFGAPEYWHETDEPGVWTLDRTIYYDIGNIVFGGGEMSAAKLNFSYSDDGTRYIYDTETKFESYHDITKNYTFWHDSGDTKALYLRLNEGNPGEVWDDIEICVWSQYGIFGNENNNNVTIDNLVFKYAGAHAIASHTCDRLTVSNCEFYWIGGSAMFPERKSDSRLGNAIEIYGGCDNYTVKNCYFRDIYDAGATFQWAYYDGTDMSQPIIMKNVTFADNVMEYCNYSIEYFLESPPEGSYMSDILFENNLCWYAGWGLPSQRSYSLGSTHIRSGEGNNPLKENFTVRNNVFAYALGILLRTYSDNNVPLYSSNVYIQNPGETFGYNGNVAERHPFDESVTDYIKSDLKDENPIVIAFPMDESTIRLYDGGLKG